MWRRVVLHIINMPLMLPSLTTAAPPTGNLVINTVVRFLQLPTGAIHLPSQENGDGVILKNAATHMCVSVVEASQVTVLEQNRVS